MPRSPSNRPTPPPSFGNGRYLVGQRLGTGGMATVFRVEDQWTGEERALKVLFHDEAENEKTRSRFLAEARTMSVLDHRNIVRIHANVVVERGSQKGIVIGKGGEMLKRIGTLARKELQRVLDCRVHLELFVKVEKDWTRSKRGLTKVGFNVY